VQGVPGEVEIIITGGTGVKVMGKIRVPPDAWIGVRVRAKDPVGGAVRGKIRDVVGSVIWGGNVELSVDSDVIFDTIFSIPNKEKQLNSTISRDKCQIMYAM
jgi:hypothetical protein